LTSASASAQHHRTEKINFPCVCTIIDKYYKSV
jgi:hypothetical protein